MLLRLEVSIRTDFVEARMAGTCYRDGMRSEQREEMEEAVNEIWSYTMRTGQLTMTGYLRSSFDYDTATKEVSLHDDRRFADDYDYASLKFVAQGRHGPQPKIIWLV